MLLPFFPIQGTECSYAEYPKFKTESDLRSCAVSLNDGLTVQATIDGVSLQSQQMPRVQSPSLFSVTFPEKNLFGAPAGPSQAVADGYYVFLQPLSTGKHDISFKAISMQEITGVQSVGQNIVYHLTVQ